MKHLPEVLDPMDKSLGALHQFAPLVLFVLAAVLLLLVALGAVNLGGLPGPAQAVILLLFAFLADYLRGLADRV